MLLEPSPAAVDGPNNICSDDDKVMLKVNYTEAATLAISTIHAASAHDNCVHYDHDLQVWI